MQLSDFEIDVPPVDAHRGLLEHLASALAFRAPRGSLPVRFAVTATRAEGYHCEVGLLRGLDTTRFAEPESIFRFVPRALEDESAFTAVLLVPTGIGCDIGGHSGDAGPVARLLGAACDRLVTHPNAVNGSDINEMPPNAWYVEGSVLARLLMGTAGLAPARANRVLLVADRREDRIFFHSAVNAANGALASGGFPILAIEEVAERMVMATAYTSSGRAAGTVTGIEHACDAIDHHRDAIDAVAITTVIDVDEALHDAYFDHPDEHVNPWGGVEAMLTHTLTALYGIPVVHSPMYENREIMNSDAGFMEPRTAAEGVSVTFLHSLFRGLAQAPRIVTGERALGRPGVVTAENVSVLVQPDGCLGLPTLAALEQGIAVIAVRENTNHMNNDLTALPWRPGQLQVVENYLEAVGVMTAMKAGIAVGTVRRPVAGAQIVRNEEGREARRKAGDAGM